jgi:hypothetical protein
MLEKIEDELATCVVQFEAKACYWEYEIVVSDQRKIEVHSMKVDGKNFLEFEDPYDGKLAGSIDIKVFRSLKKQKLVLETGERMELIVEYSNLHSDRKSEMKVKLPVPDTKRIRTERTENGLDVFIAPTLVYI